MKPRKLIIKYILCDILAAILSWSLFFLFRKLTIDHIPLADASNIFGDSNYWRGLLLVSAGWIALYAVIGSYAQPRRKSRLKELGQTATASIIGVTVLFFAIMLDDGISTYKLYYASFLFLLLTHFFLTYLGRYILTTRTVKMVHTRKIGFPSIIIGSGERAYKLFLDLENQALYTGNTFKGYIELPHSDGTGHHSSQLSRIMPRLGSLADTREIIQQMHIEEALIAIEDDEMDQIRDIMLTLTSAENLIIRITPDARDLLVGRVKVDNIFHSPLITIQSRLMPQWQYNVKRLADIVVSLLALIVLSPVYLVTAILVKCTSPGPVFYAQERIGLYGRPFKMHKFRSMYVDAESSGPALSTDNDPRITPFGRFMRKVRLDEIPQFYNVLKGTMTLVGPRPERQYYIDQIVKKAPEYMLLQRLKPGITSWGQVRFGYASNVDEMIERLQFDLLYTENMSLATDIKILLYTIIIIIQGRGK